MGDYPWGYTTWLDYPGEYGEWFPWYHGEQRYQPSGRRSIPAYNKGPTGRTSTTHRAGDTGRPAAEAHSFASNRSKSYEFPITNSAKKYQFELMTTKALNSTATILDQLSKQMKVNPIGIQRKPVNVTYKKSRTYAAKPRRYTRYNPYRRRFIRRRYTRYRRYY